MERIKITCDSASDLPRELAARYRIAVLPLGVQMGNQKLKDRVDVDSHEVYDYARNTGSLPRITAIPTEDYLRYFEEYTGQGWKVIHISLSSRISACYGNACSAAQRLEHVYVVDSCSISAGVAQLALLAAELAGADYRAKEITQALEQIKQRLDVSFVMQDPEYFHRGCRKGGLAALSAKRLHLKPEVVLSKGGLRAGRPFHGDMERSILSYVRSRIEHCRSIDTDRIFITHNGVPQEILDKVTELIRQLCPFEQILQVPAASVVSSRCGPGSLGLAFLKS